MDFIELIHGCFANSKNIYAAICVLFVIFRFTLTLKRSVRQKWMRLRSAIPICVTRKVSVVICVQNRKSSKKVCTSFFEKRKKINHNSNRNRCLFICFQTENVQTRINLMNATPTENLKSFGDHIVRLVDALERSHKSGKLRRMPVGPLANFIEVKNGKYRQYVEDILGPMSMAFCVDNSDDLLVFRGILKSMQMNQPPQVICAPFFDTVYNVDGKCVVPDAHTVRLMDLIVVENPIAMNCLIDHCNIETILFTESFEHATHLTSTRANVPPNLSRLILLEPYSEYFPAPNYRSYAKTSRTSRFLRVSEAQREL